MQISLVERRIKLPSVIKNTRYTMPLLLFDLWIPLSDNLQLPPLIKGEAFFRLSADRELSRSDYHALRVTLANYFFSPQPQQEQFSSFDEQQLPPDGQPIHLTPFFFALTMYNTANPKTMAIITTATKSFILKLLVSVHPF